LVGSKKLFQSHPATFTTPIPGPFNELQKMIGTKQKVVSFDSPAFAPLGPYEKSVVCHNCSTRRGKPQECGKGNEDRVAMVVVNQLRRICLEVRLAQLATSMLMYAS
jgi:hypothetical protein